MTAAPRIDGRSPSGSRVAVERPLGLVGLSTQARDVEPLTALCEAL